MKTTIAKKYTGYDHAKEPLGEVLWWVLNGAVHIRTQDGVYGSLRKHNIDEEGVVTPSVLIVQPPDYEWHAMVKLDDWDAPCLSNSQGAKE